MSELLRDLFIDPLNRTGVQTKAFFYDRDFAIVDNITLDQANRIAQVNPSQLFYIQDRNGIVKEFTAKELNDFYNSPNNSLSFVSDCSVFAQPCGPPLLALIGGGGVGAQFNPIISPVSSAILGFDVISKGKNYLSTPVAQLVNSCGKGTGASFTVLMEPYNGDPNTGGGLQVKDILVNSPGDGYLSSFDGSFGGSGITIKSPEEGLIQNPDGTFTVVPPNTTPILNPGDVYYPPITGQEPKDNSTYPIIIEIGDIIIDDPGFGYNPGDSIILNPGNGAVLEPVIDNIGRIIDVNIINPGLGFDDFPEISVDSETGFNFSAKILFKFRRLLDRKDLFDVPGDAKILSVVDCVGKVVR